MGHGVTFSERLAGWVGVASVWCPTHPLTPSQSGRGNGSWLLWVVERVGC